MIKEIWKRHDTQLPYEKTNQVWDKSIEHFIYGILSTQTEQSRQNSVNPDQALQNVEFDQGLH